MFISTVYRKQEIRKTDDYYEAIFVLNLIQLDITK